MEGTDIAGLKLLPDSARRQLCLDLLHAAEAVSIRINDSSGEIIHGCLLNPQAHHDQVSNPTASINYRTLAGSCFGCRASGGLLWFIATVLRTDTAGARAWLHDTSSVPQDGVLPLPLMLSSLQRAFQPPPAAPAIPVYHPSALDAFHHRHPYWTDPPAPPGTPGGGRGVHPATVDERRLGYDPATGRVIIPHFWKGQLVGWQSRPAGPVPPKTAKYINTPDFPRRSTLYRLNPHAEEIVLVESVATVLRHAHVMDDLAATFGALVHDEQLQQVVRLPRLRRVILWPDADAKGWDAVDGAHRRADGLIARLTPYVPVYVVNSPFSGDGADLDTGTAVAVREHLTVPAVVWQRPRELSCPYCRIAYHQGPCQPARLAA